MLDSTSTAGSKSSRSVRIWMSRSARIWMFCNELLLQGRRVRASHGTPTIPIFRRSDHALYWWGKEGTGYLSWPRFHWSLVVAHLCWGRIYCYCHVGYMCSSCNCHLRGQVSWYWWCITSLYQGGRQIPSIPRIGQWLRFLLFGVWASWDRSFWSRFRIIEL